MKSFIISNSSSESMMIGVDAENLKTTGANGACGTEPILTGNEPHPELEVEH